MNVTLTAKVLSDAAAHVAGGETSLSQLAKIGVTSALALGFGQPLQAILEHSLGAIQKAPALAKAMAPTLLSAGAAYVANRYGLDLASATAGAIALAGSTHYVNSNPNLAAVSPAPKA